MKNPLKGKKVLIITKIKRIFFCKKVKCMNNKEKKFTNRSFQMRGGNSS